MMAACHHHLRPRLQPLNNLMNFVTLMKVRLQALDNGGS